MQHNLVKAYALPKTFQKLTKLLLVALFCGVIGGCDPWYSGWEYKYTETKVLSGGIISDTTALLLMKTYDWWANGGPGGGTEERNAEEYLVLADVRFENIYWKKSFNGGVFTIIDSIMFFDSLSYDYNNNSFNIGKVSTIIIDEQFEKLEKIVVPKGKELEFIGKGWEYSSGIRVRPWHTGLILANHFFSLFNDGNFTNDYALIDTIAGTFERFTPSGEFEWMNNCMDVKWSSVGGLCLKQIPDATGFMLLKNGKDTLAVRYHESNGSWLKFEGNSIYSSGWTFLIYKNYEVSKNPFRNLVNYNKEFRK